MYVVTGTKRSGTSMWMQALKAAGIPLLGRPFLGRWEASISEANPAGFYESRFRRGVYFATNPDPATGVFFRPDQVCGHAVKIFVPGLVRTDYGYIERVLATMRSWREYEASLARLHALERNFHARHEHEHERDGGAPSVPPAGARVPPASHPLPAAFEWWFDNYRLIRDIATRRYPVHVVTYEAVLNDPEHEIRAVFGWLGRGNAQDALMAIQPKLRTQRGPHSTSVDPKFAAVFDELYTVVATRGELSQAFVDMLNDTHARIVAHLRERGLVHTRRGVRASTLPSPT